VFRNTVWAAGGGRRMVAGDGQRVSGGEPTKNMVVVASGRWQVAGGSWQVAGGDGKWR